MPRPPRPPTLGALVHVFDHAVGSQRLFLDEGDRRAFLHLLGNVAVEERWTLLAWCLMGNHLHLLLFDGAGDLSGAMRSLKSRYAFLFNRRHRRFGPLFGSRYGARHVLDESHLLNALRYVVLNPVGAGLVRHPADWLWSSYRATTGEDPAPRWFDAGSILTRFAPEPADARERFRAFVEQGIGARPFDFRAAQKREARWDAARGLSGGTGGVRA